MKTRQRIAGVSALILVAVVLAGCPPHSKLYRGFSEVEQEHFNKASREIFPNDVRTDLERYRSSKVAWPGFVTDAQWLAKGDGFEVKFKIEHHYYDWILDYSIQKEKIFLSPRGEGKLETSCPSKPGQESQVLGMVGHLVIIYGVPLNVEQGVVSLTCDFASTINRKWVRTDAFDYGRPGEPVKFLNVPGPGAGTVLKKNPPQ